MISSLNKISITDCITEPVIELFYLTSCWRRKHKIIRHPKMCQEYAKNVKFSTKVEKKIFSFKK